MRKTPTHSNLLNILANDPNYTKDKRDYLKPERPMAKYIQWLGLSIRLGRVKGM
jgi:hypothetical protein